MAGAPVEVTPTEMKWYYPLLGLVFAGLILAAAVASAISQREDSYAGDDHSDDHSGEVHDEDDDH